jgi:exonuclease VII small subunit
MARKALQIVEVSVKEMANVLANLNGYKGFITLVAETEQNSKLFSPVANFGKGVQISKICKTTLNFGGDYEKKMQDVTNDADFKAQKPFGKHHINQYLLQKDSDENVFYFRTYKVNSKGMTRTWDSRYMVDGTMATDEMTAKIKSLYRPVNPSPVPVRDYTVNNILSARINRVDYIVRK